VRIEAQQERENTKVTSDAKTWPGLGLFNRWTLGQTQDFRRSLDRMAFLQKLSFTHSIAGSVSIGKNCSESTRNGDPIIKRTARFQGAGANCPTMAGGVSCRG